jgi:hypothetical protein
LLKRLVGELGKWREEPLPSELAQKVQDLEPINIIHLEGKVSVIGLNTLKAWGVVVDPEKGLQ